MLSKIISIIVIDAPRPMGNWPSAAAATSSGAGAPQPKDQLAILSNTPISVPFIITRGSPKSGCLAQQPAPQCIA